VSQPPPHPSSGLSPEQSAAVVATLRRFLRANSEEEVVGALIGVVGDLGGRAEVPHAVAVGQLPVDLTFGVGGPLVPTGDEATLSRLVEVLPALVEDARMALGRLRREQRLAEDALSDSLTGLANRRVTIRIISRLTTDDCVAMVDLDHFKTVNDTLGHHVGDAVLRDFARTLRTVMRAGDTAGRIGGEEFALVLPKTDVAGAARLLARLQAEWIDRRSHPITFSAGVSAIGDDGPSVALRRADAALYRAKRAGRDRVVFTGDDDEGSVSWRGSDALDEGTEGR
jgi:diguanylate cyclase (GGDEF)-like protein